MIMPSESSKKRPKKDRKKRLEEMDPEVLDVEGAARVLGVSKWTILKYARAGKLPGKKVGKEWRFRRSTILRWLGEPASAQPVDPENLSREEIIRMVETGKATPVLRSRGGRRG